MTSSAKIPPPTVVDDTHKKYGVTVGLLILGIVSTLFSLSRLWCRASMRAFGLDDYATIPALVSISTARAR